MPRYEEDRIDYLFKLVIVGDSGVGKTSLLLKYVDDVFTDTFISTIGVDFKIRTFDMDGKKVKLQIWDTAGQDRFKNIVSTFYRNAHGILLVYDVTDVTSFQNIQQWLKEIDKYAGQKAKQVLVGNKCDLAPRRQVSLEEGRALAATTSMMHIETSAKTSANLEALFSDLTRDLMANFEPVNYGLSKPDLTPLPPSHKVATGGRCGC
ncbi:uncharacterized protein [Littorina saxatilis]|uniref:Uncharacterized protein n=1 Tax=Littorina saxatilis TaxID=31220 RepID=A0AAN9G194_9CAEN